MWEMRQLALKSPSFYLDMYKYIYPWYGLEFLTTELPQIRIVPVEKSLSPGPQGAAIAPYDHIRKIIEQTDGQIAVINCVCKDGKDLVSDPCKATDRRDLCIILRDYADTCVRNGWARSITKQEAIDILNQNEKDGLVLNVSNTQEPQFICSCCRCCCGLLEALNMMPRPADFAASNYYAVLDPQLCTGCHLCIKRCQMGAIHADMQNKKSIPEIELRRCIGCGLCVTPCPKEAIKLKKKDEENFLPRDMDHLYEVILQNKKGIGGKLAKMTRALMGMKT
jgi:Na+-translocating ferredoxin:NAD+ oxidoreductase RNF subunit RnfB